MCVSTAAHNCVKFMKNEAHRNQWNDEWPSVSCDSTHYCLHEGNKKNKSRLKIDCYLFFLCSKVVPKQQLTPYILSQQPLKGMKHRQLSLRFSSPHMTVFATPLTWPLYSAAFHIVMKTYSSRKFTIRDTCPWFILGKSMNSSRSTCKIFVLRPFLYTSYNKDSK